MAPKKRKRHTLERRAQVNRKRETSQKITLAVEVLRLASILTTLIESLRK